VTVSRARAGFLAILRKGDAFSRAFARFDANGVALVGGDLQDHLPPHEPRRTQDRARGRAALAVRPLEGLGFSPRPEGGLVAPDRV
jgi:hypothetical protein